MWSTGQHEQQQVNSDSLSGQTQNKDAATSSTRLKQTSDSLQTVGNVKVANSNSVHIGNLTNLNGTIQIIRNRSGKKKFDINSNAGHGTSLQDKAGGAFAEAAVSHKILNIVLRSSWLAQSPMEPPDVVAKPVPFVVVAHTATESSEKRAANVRIVRDIQCLHIETRGLNDIAYNFLIGCDGNVYAGRGWGVVGAHTMGYNTRSLGVAFIGGFMRTSPTKAALKAFQNLMKNAVHEGYLAADYKLIGQCQCFSTESPGEQLFEIFQSWKHFYKIENEEEETDDDN